MPRFHIAQLTKNCSSTLVAQKFLLLAMISITLSSFHTTLGRFHNVIAKSVRGGREHARLISQIS